MIKTLWILFCCLLINILALAQDTLQQKSRERFFISVKAGGYYKFFIGNNYISPTLEAFADDFEDHQYDRFTKTPTFGLQTGIMSSFNMQKGWFIVLGLSFCNRRIVYENNKDTVVKYGNGSRIQDIHNVYKYDYSYDNFELQFMLSYKFNKLSLYAGAYIPVLTFYQATYSYLILQLPEPRGTSQKTIKGVEIPLMIFPSILASYKITIKTFSFHPYLGIDFGSKKSVYLHGGIIFTIASF